MKLPTRIHYARQDYRRRLRLLFPSPAEIRFIRLMGGWVVTLPFISIPPHGFRLAFVITLGRTLKREYCQREVRAGAMFIDFGFETPWVRKAVEIDGRDFHRDVAYEQQRDDYLRKYGWRVLHIQAIDLYRRPKDVKKRVYKFLSQK